MSPTKIKFIYDHTGPVSGSDVSLEMNINAHDLDDIVDAFKGFLAGAGFDHENIKDVFDGEEYYKQLYETELHLKKHYKDLCDKLEKELLDENDS